MRLQEYEVIYTERAENTVHICRKPPEAKLYRIVETADKKKTAGYIQYFRTRSIRGFYEDFCLNEKYYAVFDNPDGVPLRSSGEPLTAERVVRALTMQNPPLEIAVKILSADLIFVCGEEMEFAYCLPETDRKVTKKMFFRKLADFVESLWEKPISEQAQGWLADLRGDRFENLPEAYRHMPDPAVAPEPSGEERINKIKAAVMKAAAVVAAVLAAAAAVLLALGGGESEPEYGNMEYIGTIDL